MQVITTWEHYELANTFMKHYEFLTFAGLPEISNAKELKNKKERKCRYCGGAYPNVSFHKDAHLFPELIGNKTLFCDYECDDCNWLFGTYENNFTRLIEFERRISKTRVKGGYPKFTSTNKEIKVQTTEFHGVDATEIGRALAGSDNMIFDEETASWRIKFKLNGYVPNKIYKYFIKLGLSLLPENVVHDKYAHALNYISKKPNWKLKDCWVQGYQINLGTSFRPHVYIYKKKDTSLKAPTHVMAFYCLNLIFTVALPFYKDDFSFYNEIITPIPYPPFFAPDADICIIRIDEFAYNLNSEETKKQEEKEIIFEMNKEAYEKRVAVNKNTLEEIPDAVDDKSKTMKFILVPKDTVFPIAKSDQNEDEKNN